MFYQNGVKKKSTAIVRASIILKAFKKYITMDENILLVSLI